MPRTKARWLAVALAGGVGLVGFSLAGSSSKASALTATTTTASATVPSDALAAPSPPWSGNLLNAVSASMSGQGIWSSSLSSLTEVASPTQAGAGALAVTNTSGETTDPAVFTGTGKSSWLPATANTTYRGTIWVSAATVSRDTTPFLEFYNSAGTSVGYVQGQQEYDAVGSWLEEAPEVAIAPPSTAYMEFGVVFWNAAAGETHYVDTATVQAVSGTTPSVVGPLSTSGNKIVQANGNPVVLRGINRAGMEFYSSYTAITQAEINQAHNWGANFIRLGVSEQAFLSTGCDYSASYATTLDQVINWITSDGMVALIDPVEYDVPCSTSTVERPMADPMTITFWQQVAARYENNPLVAFDLFNEPHNMPASTWLNGGIVTDTTGSYQVVGMQQLYNAVRSTGATNLVFAEGNNWASTYPSDTPVAGYNIVYAVHYYSCPEVPMPACTIGNPYSAAPVLQNWVSVAQQVPVVFDEFGYPSSSDGGYPANAIAFAEANDMGWAMMGWNGNTLGLFNTLVENGDTGYPTSTYEPSPTGMPLLAGLSLNR